MRKPRIILLFMLLVTMVAGPRASFAVAQQAKLVAATPADAEGLGGAVAVSGDTAVVGAPEEGSSAGAAYVFQRSGAIWRQQARFIGVGTGFGDRFGHSVDVDGDTVIVGAYLDDERGTNSGSAFIFARVGSTWSLQAKLLASDGFASDLFGIAVAVSGDTALIGAAGDDVGGSDTGSAYVYTRSGSTWTQRTKLNAPAPNDTASFGQSVALDGGTAVVGAPLHDATFGNAGTAYVFTGSGANWSLQGHLLAADRESNDHFGTSVAVSGSTVVAGVPHDSVGGVVSGSARVYVRSGTVWSPQATLVASDAEGGDLFGEAVAISGDVVLAGARSDRDAGVFWGAAIAFKRAGSTWTQSVKLRPSDGPGGLFGSTVALSGGTAIVGRPHDSTVGVNAGSAYAFIGLAGPEPPAISAVVSPAPNVEGWSNTVPVTVSFVCSDDAPVASCPGPLTLTADTPGQVVSGTVVDGDGNTANTSVTVRIDTTPAVVTIDDPSMGTGLPLPARMLTGTVSDALAGVERVDVTIRNGLRGTALVRRAEVTGNTWRVSTGGLGPGLDTASVVSRDLAGNESEPVTSGAFIAPT